MMKLNVIQFNLVVQPQLQSALSPGALQKPSGRDELQEKHMQDYWKYSRKYFERNIRNLEEDQARGGKSC